MTTTRPPTPGGATRRRRLSPDERREAIVAAGAGAFVAAGYAGTAMEDVAAAVGVTKLIVYRHFPTKEDLYRAVLERAAERVAHALRAGLDADGFIVGARPVLAAAREDPDAFLLLWRHAAREPRFADYADALHAETVRVLRTRFADVVPAEDLDYAAHRTVAFLVEAVIDWLRFGSPEGDERFVRANNAGLRAGVRAWSIRS